MKTIVEDRFCISCDKMTPHTHKVEPIEYENFRGYRVLDIRCNTCNKFYDIFRIMTRGTYL